MTGEFTAFCTRYYQLTQLLSKREERFNNLLANAPLYSGQTNLSQIDEIISYYREVQTAKAKMDKTADDKSATERVILAIMQHFEIPPGTTLTGEIPNELEYELWADENDALHIIKTKSLQPEPDNSNVIEIKVWSEEDED